MQPLRRAADGASVSSQPFHSRSGGRHGRQFRSDPGPEAGSPGARRKRRRGARRHRRSRSAEAPHVHSAAAVGSSRRRSRRPPGLPRREPARDARDRSPRRSCPARPRPEWPRSSTSCWPSTRPSGSGTSWRRWARCRRSRCPLRKALAVAGRRAEDRPAHLGFDGREVADAALLEARRAGAGARAAEGAAHASRPLRSPEGADRDRLLQLRERHEGAGVDGTDGPRRSSRAARTRAGTRRGDERAGRLTAARVLHYRWPIRNRAGASPASLHSAVSIQVYRNGQRRSVVHSAPRRRPRGRPDRSPASRSAAQRRARASTAARAGPAQAAGAATAAAATAAAAGRRGRPQPRKPRLPQRDVAEDEPLRGRARGAVADGAGAAEDDGAAGSTSPSSRS